LDKIVPEDSVDGVPFKRIGPRVRDPLHLLLGSLLIGFALVLLLFGGRLMGDGDDGVANQAVGQASDLRSLGSGPAFSSEQSLVQVGDRALDFALNDLDGNRYELSEMEGRPVVLNFWATWCAPCRIEMPELQAAFEKHQEDGLIMLALDYDEPESTVRPFFYDEFELTFTPLIDEDGLVAESYGVFNFPSTIFISPEGIVKAIHRGPMIQAQIEEHLAKIIPDQI
jgi:peroxiredoxin